MRRLLIIGATTVAAMAIGGTALAASGGSGSRGPGRHDDHPSQIVVSPGASQSPVEDHPSRGVDDNPTPHERATSVPAGTPAPTRTVDDHGGLRNDNHGGGGHGADDGPGDDRGGHGHGGDDRGGDDHGGSGRR
ncbi:hypothetical protein [Dactylosporangium sp. CA-233914]|uniref:hypothetical protein n=1 Tax=Dactylosporangium sp. CA-233914 TaxID=3239934 RepID=UPI003D931396